MTRFLQGVVAGLAVVAVTLGAPTARAEILSYKAVLAGSHEIPPNQSKGAGTVTLSYDTAAKTLSWKGNHSGLSGPVTAAHFHGPAALGKNAGIALAIANGALPAEFEGSTPLTEAQAADLMAGRWYLNLHTAAFPAGEIRGQVVK